MSENFSVFNKLRLEQQLCDAVIRVDNVEFLVHKVFLCSCSSYFRTLFTHWSSPDCQIFDIPDVSPEMMELFIEFAYTGVVPVTIDNVQVIFIAADRFNVTGILQACSEFLEKKLTPQNCIGIWLFLDIYYYPELRNKSFHFMLSHFEEVFATSDEFLFLSVEQLVKLIESDQLIVKQEESVYMAILVWIGFAPEERREYAPQLLSKVRLALMRRESLTNITENKVVMSNLEYQDIALQTQELILDHVKHISNKSIIFKSLAHPRVPPSMLLCIGGWTSGNPTNIIEAYDARTDRWANVACTQRTPRAYHGAVFLDGSVYCVGGFDSVMHFSSVHRFDLGTQTWQEMSPMHSSRCFVSVTVLDGQIYALGGFNGDIRLDTAECYEPSTNQWTAIASMNDQRSEASCATFLGRVYICGGFNGRACLSTAEFYDPVTDQWTLIASMNSRRSGIGVIVYENKIFAVGGFNGVQRLQTAEAYDPLTNTWESVPSMLMPRSNFGISVIDDRLFVVGGYNGIGTVDDVEFYNDETGVWSIACDMKMSRSSLSCCTVYGLSNMDYFAAIFDPLQFRQLRSDYEDELEE
ncbi:kelch-like protein 10 [Cololabis saira]|uniref:kelch-like protein 10 n=1 Tax=Cololabis saira TaxID=129043 RepID=UPI002AD4C6C1|nr:kelch-like protein 10 [Cololabis saira]